jgi:HlyD family secretion protein
MKRMVGVLIAVAMIGLVGYYVWEANHANRPVFRTVNVTLGDLFVGVTASGTVEPEEMIDVGAQIVGTVKSFAPDLDHPDKRVDYRSRVKKGMLLATLDDDVHKSDVEKAKANLKLAEAQLVRAKARQKQAERNYDRAEQLKDVDSAAEFENALAERDITRAESSIAEATVIQAKSTLDQAEVKLSYTKITSPVDGVVIDSQVKVGETLIPAMKAPTLFLLAKDLKHMRVWSAVNEADIGDIYVGQKVNFTVDAYRDRKFTAKVSQIRLNAGLQQNVVTYGVVVDVENQDGKLLPFMTAKLKFEVTLQPHVIQVPNQALRWRPTWEQITPSARDGFTRPSPSLVVRPENESEEDSEPKVEVKEPTVWTIAEDGLVQPVRVKTGMSDGMASELLSGNLKPGTALVSNVLHRAEPDFVTVFISKITPKKKHLDP